MSKAGVLMLTRGLAAALAPAIQVNAVGPGVVLLPDGFPRDSAARLATRIPMRRSGDPTDVAAAVRFFATCPAYITGQILYVDGGATAV
jgi:NAD(P)-dependent dehydrogenase (short-subunit alcohol dehydrogenase family)